MIYLKIMLIGHFLKLSGISVSIPLHLLLLVVSIAMMVQIHEVFIIFNYKGLLAVSVVQYYIYKKLSP